MNWKYFWRKYLKPAIKGELSFYVTNKDIKLLFNEIRKDKKL